MLFCLNTCYNKRLSSQLLIHLPASILSLLSLLLCTSILFAPFKTLPTQPLIDLLSSKALHIHEFHLSLILPLHCVILAPDASMLKKLHAWITTCLRYFNLLGTILVSWFAEPFSNLWVLVQLSASTACECDWVMSNTQNRNLITLVLVSHSNCDCQTKSNTLHIHITK